MLLPTHKNTLGTTLKTSMLATPGHVPSWPPGSQPGHLGLNPATGSHTDHLGPIPCTQIRAPRSPPGHLGPIPAIWVSSWPVSGSHPGTLVPSQPPQSHLGQLGPPGQLGPIRSHGYHPGHLGPIPATWVPSRPPGSHLGQLGPILASWVPSWPAESHPISWVPSDQLGLIRSAGSHNGNLGPARPTGSNYQKTKTYLRTLPCREFCRRTLSFIMRLNRYFSRLLYYTILPAK